MKKKFLLGLVFAITLPIIIFNPGVVKASANDFTIKDFQADYYLDKDSEGLSTLKTVEKITAEFPNIDHSRLTQEEYMLVIGNSTLKKWSDYKRWIRGYQSELDEINDNENVSEEEKALCTSILNKHNAL